jgi:hypothetical protein
MSVWAGGSGQNQFKCINERAAFIGERITDLL